MQHPKLENQFQFRNSLGITKKIVELRIQHVYREGNQEADSLASKGEDGEDVHIINS